MEAEPGRNDCLKMQPSQSQADGLKAWEKKRRMNLKLLVRKVCFNGNRRDRVRDQTRRKPLALMKTGHWSGYLCVWGLGVREQWDQSHSPGGSQVMSTGSSKSQRLTANLSMRRNLTSVSWPNKAALGLSFLLGFGEKGQLNHASKILGASTAFLRTVPPQK